MIRSRFVVTISLVYTALAPGIFAQSPSQPGGAGGAPLSLATLVREATERNPEVMAARRAVEAKRARVPQAGAWADPMVSVSYGGNALPPFTVMRADPSSAREVTVQQTIPYPGKTLLRTQIASRDADAETLAYEAVTRQLIAEIKQAYFELCYLNHSLTTLQTDREVLKELEQVTEVRYSVGKAAQQDVLRAQMELTRLSERETMARHEHHMLLARINALRNAPIDAPLPDPADIKPSAVTYTEAELLDAAGKSYPALKQQRAMVDEDRLSVDLARKEVRPDFSVGYTYMQRDGLPDMYGITLSTSLPFFRRRKQDAAIAEAAANLESARQTEAQDLITLRYRIRQDFLEVRDSEEVMKLYSEGIKPQSALTLQSSLSSYETGGLDFLSVLSNFQTEVDAELDYHRQIADHEKALARLEEATGLDLIQQSEVTK